MFRLEFLYYPARRFWLDSQALRFSLGQAGGAVLAHQVVRTASRYAPLDAWRYAIRSLKIQTIAPIGFIYSPGIPFLRNGKIIKEDDYADWAMQLRAICQAEGVDFIDLTANNIDLYERERILPRGFNNGKPGQGHCNPQGIRVIAEAVVKCLENIGNAIHSD